MGIMDVIGLRRICLRIDKLATIREILFPLEGDSILLRLQS